MADVTILSFMANGKAGSVVSCRVMEDTKKLHTKRDGCTTNSGGGRGCTAYECGGGGRNFYQGVEPKVRRSSSNTTHGSRS